MTAASLPMRARSSHLGCSSGLLSPFMLGDPAQNHKCQNVPSRNFIPSALFPLFKAPHLRSMPSAWQALCPPHSRNSELPTPPRPFISTPPSLFGRSRAPNGEQPRPAGQRGVPPFPPPVAVSTPPRTVMSPGDSINRNAMWATPPATSGRCPQAGAAPPRHPWENQSADSSAGAATSAHPCASVLKGNGGGVCRIKA